MKVITSAVILLLPLLATALSPYPHLPQVCQDAAEIDSQSTLLLNHKLQHLLSESTYFSVFSVALDKNCPFWRDVDAQCFNRECTVEDCPETEVPAPWRRESNCITKVSSEDNLNNVDRSLTGLAALVGQPIWEAADATAWTVRDQDDERMFVDLRKNPEQYTGYSGASAVRVWQAVYDENCFTFSDKCSSGICDLDTCKEERVLYRLISGLHASISTHIAKRYLNEGVWGINLDIFKARIRAYPERVANLKVAYAVVVRAISKASMSLHPGNFSYFTGNDKNDEFTRTSLIDLFELPILLPGCEYKVFDESDMFQQNYLLPEFRSAFRNISMIMDCVGCEKCRLWGKLQFLGLGAALRILFEEETPELERNDVIALLNLLYKLSTSIIWVEKMEAMVLRNASINTKLRFILTICFVSALTFFLWSRVRKQERSSPQKDVRDNLDVRKAPSSLADASQKAIVSHTSAKLPSSLRMRKI